MKKIILIGATLLVTATTILIASNNCSDCPLCPAGSCPLEKCCDAGCAK